MKRIALVVLLLSLFGVCSAQGKNFSHNQSSYSSGNVKGMIFQLNPQYVPHTGDRDFDRLLIEINRTAGGRLQRYMGDISTVFHIPQEKIMVMLYQEHMQPADVFMVYQLVRLSGQPYQKVMKHYRRHGRKGWGAVALSLGMRPGSKKFLLLRQNVPNIIWNYAVVWHGNHGWTKGSKIKKGSKRKKGSRRKKGSKGRR
jgi:hypothetical protein